MLVWEMMRWKTEKSEVVAATELMAYRPIKDRVKKEVINERIGNFNAIKIKSISILGFMLIKYRTYFAHSFEYLQYLY